MSQTQVPPPRVRVRRRRKVAVTPQTRALHIEHRALSSLTPYARNARRHSDKQIELIARAIENFGFNNPILIDEHDVIVAGHGRYEAARLLRLSAVPTVRLDHLSPPQVKAFRLADNQLASLSSWDETILKTEVLDLTILEDSGALNFDLDVIGFDTPKIDLILSTGETHADLPAETVSEPDPLAQPVSASGDIWQLGRHRVLCGSALEPGNFLALMDGKTANMIFTDPPYNVPVNGHMRTKGDHAEFVMAAGELSAEAFEDFLEASIGHATKHLTAGGIAMAFMDWRHITSLLKAGQTLGLDYLNLCVWNKTNGGMGGLYRSKHELVAVFRKSGKAHVNNVALGRHGRNRSNVWDYAGVNSFGTTRDADLADHPTVKPTALVADAIRDVTHRRDIVLDPFGGSGSTLLAAERTGRTARLIEIDPKYVDVVIRRWQDLTGLDAVHAAHGRAFSEMASGAEGAEQPDGT
uniref:site-specific DNA-methyltransferase n=1 Tax=Roseovarius indicus TaxID=540747 RepID=UPI003B5258EB